MKINKKLNKNTKWYMIIAAAVVLIACGYMGVAYVNKFYPFIQNTSTPFDDFSVNLERSDSEIKQSKALEEDPELKLRNGQTDQPSTPAVNSDSGKQAANVLLTNAGIIDGNVRASGMVTNLVEDDGECEYVFSSGESSIMRKTKTLTNPTSTTCEAVIFPASELPVNGTWKVVVNYSSPKSEGKSNQKEFVK